MAIRIRNHRKCRLMNKIKKEKKLTQVFLFGFLILFFSVLFFAPLNNTRVVFALTIEEWVAASENPEATAAAAEVVASEAATTAAETAASAVVARAEAAAIASDPTATQVEIDAAEVVATEAEDIADAALATAIDARDTANTLASKAGTQTVALSPGYRPNDPLTYSSLEPIPGVDYSTPENPGSYLASLIKVIIGITTALAVLIITIAGIEHILGAGKEDARTAAKEKMYGALIGLIIALASYLILNTINPNLLNLDLSMPEINATAPAPPPTAYQTCMSKCLEKRKDDGLITATDDGIAQCQDPTECGPPPASHVLSGVADDSVARNPLVAVGITITSTGHCSDINNPSCTSLTGLPQKAVDGLLQLQTALRTHCNVCVVRITGGTETGHASHGAGIATVDISYSADVFQALKDIGLTENSSFTGGINTRNAFTCEPPGGGSHPVPCGNAAGVIHVQF
ncbi:pilin [Patescibacteria group bacterium]|nr:pilin [Patescibacteria group bacterium]